MRIHWLAKSMFIAALSFMTMLLSIWPSICETNKLVSLTVSAHMGNTRLWLATTKNNQEIEHMNSRINALPPLPYREHWHCLHYDGSYYELVFEYNDNAKTIIKIQRRGCRWVTFQDNNRHALWAINADSLYRKLQTFRPKDSPDFQH